jgi:glycerol uptake facilitator-like aquaporin
LGTLFIVFFGCGSVLSPALASNENFVQISLSFGFAVFVGVQLAGPVSGGYLNPAVTFASLISGRLGLVRAVLFTLVQFLGAVGMK